MAEDRLQVEISFRDEELQGVRSALEEAGATDIKEAQQQGMAGIDLIVWAGIALGAPLVGLVATVMRLWKCGVIVDTRGTKVLVEKNCDLPRGTVLVISKDGTRVQLDGPSHQQLNESISKPRPEDS